MEIVQIKVNDRLQRVIRIQGIVSAEDLVIADLPEQLPEAGDIVVFLQAVERVKRETELVVAVLRQCVAALSGTSRPSGFGWRT